MRILISLSLFATLLLSACGSGETDTSSGSLDTMFGDETEVQTDSTATVELPASEGPSEAPLVQTTPNE